MSVGETCLCGFMESLAPLKSVATFQSSEARNSGISKSQGQFISFQSFTPSRPRPNFLPPEIKHGATWLFVLWAPLTSGLKERRVLKE